MSKLLYYPYISIPNATWLAQSLLYWDGLATIVPTEFLRNPHGFSPFARQLLQDGVIEAVLPEEYAYSRPDDFLRFLEWVEEHLSEFSLNYPKRTLVPTRMYHIHVGKLGFIGSELEHWGLSQRVDNKWYTMDPKLAQAFMTFLAILIGQETDRIPMTDTYQGMSSLFCIGKLAPRTNAQIVRNKLRGSILDHILPVPSLVENYTDLLRFKDRYHDELVRFRCHIEDFIVSLEESSPEVQYERCRHFLLNAQEEIDQIKGHMGYFHAPEIDMGTFVAALPSVFGVARGNYENAVVNLVPVIGEMVVNRERGANRRKPLAYAALYKNRTHFQPPRKRYSPTD